MNIQPIVQIPDSIFPLIADMAKESKKDVDVFIGEKLSSGAVLKQLADERAYQIFFSIIALGQIPDEIIAESARRAAA